MIFSGTTISYKVIEKPTESKMEYPESSIHIGSMTESSKGALEDCLCPIEENEVIIYGKKGDYLVLTFLKKKVSYKSKELNIEDKIECKIRQKGIYLCAFTKANTVYVYIYNHIIKNGRCTMKGSYF